MALRYLLLMLALVTAANAASVKRFPLDDRTAYTVRISQDAPTTILFPGPIAAIDSANLSARPEDNPPVLLAHTASTSFLSVRALRPDAKAAINVVYREKIYALTFGAGDPADRTVTFYDLPSHIDHGSLSPRLSPIRFLALFDQAKIFSDLTEQYPAIAARIQRAVPNTIATLDRFTLVIEEVFRFELEDALVFHLRVENPTDAAIRYRPLDITVRTGRFICPVLITDASGDLPPRSVSHVYVVIAGTPDGENAGLSVDNPFTVNLALTQ